MNMNFPASPIAGQAYPTPAVQGLPQYVFDGTVWNTSDYVDPSVLAFSGMQVNGGGDVRQEHAEATITYPAGGAVSWPVDGWYVASSGTQAMTGRFILGNTPPGMNYPGSFNMQVTTANPSPAASTHVHFAQRLEGYRVARLMWGTVHAQPLSAGFWVAANRPGQYGGAVSRSPFDRSYPFLFTINASNTWEWKTITIPGDTGGGSNWNKTNGVGLIFMIAMMAASDLSGPPGAWTGTGCVGATGGINGVQATSDSMSVTGFILLPGIYLPPLSSLPRIMRGYTDELLLCRRYWWCSNPTAPKGTGAGMLCGHSGLAGMICFSTWRFTVPMRVPPDLKLWNSGVANQVRITTTAAVLATGGVTNHYLNTEGGSQIFVSSLAAGQWIDFDLIADARVGF